MILYTPLSLTTIKNATQCSLSKFHASEILRNEICECAVYIRASLSYATAGRASYDVGKTFCACVTMSPEKLLLFMLLPLKY